jgi:hypothetical protein
MKYDDRKTSTGRMHIMRFLRQWEIYIQDDLSFSMDIITAKQVTVSELNANYFLLEKPAKKEICVF